MKKRTLALLCRSAGYSCRSCRMREVRDSIHAEYTGRKQR